MNTVAQDIQDRRSKDEKARDLMKRHPGEVLTHEQFVAAGAGAAVHSRISHCSNEWGMCIESIPTRYLGADGKSHAGFNSYRYWPGRPPIPKRVKKVAKKKAVTRPAARAPRSALAESMGQRGLSF